MLRLNTAHSLLSLNTLSIDAGLYSSDALRPMQYAVNRIHFNASFNQCCRGLVLYSQHTPLNLKCKVYYVNRNLQKLSLSYALWVSVAFFMVVSVVNSGLNFMGLRW